MKRIARLSLTATVLSCGCTDFPEIEYRTARAEIGTTLDDPLCQGDLDAIDAQIEAIEARTGVQHDGPVRIYLYGTPEELPCDVSPFGCYMPRQDAVATTATALDHELVHAVLRNRDFSRLFWSEGLAEGLKGQGTLLNTSGDVLASYDADESSKLDYRAAGHFMRWLVETRGLSAMQDFIAGESFESAFGGPLQELADEHDASAPYAYPDWEPCSGPELASSGEESWRESVTASCSDPETERLTVGVPTVTRIVTLEGGAYEVSMSGGVGLWIRGCLDKALQDELPSYNEDGSVIYYWNGDVFNEAQFSHTGLFSFFPSERVHELELTPGRYEVAIEAGADDPATVNWRSLETTVVP
ncbi:hypothetical protein PPSIR1_38514 [Plesiocystis pacifica SIR-1]|uniref:Lipoprotein n=1 Tax=Plesiocystis pacifica SIR-1 TaxID=391625 RepID=A6G8M6_9BACT|nr:hypothetical protein [Plesiocystis pacifica]EDM77803.1 hypothetical protein PPSIR1_38514 [Plesiocystis pacifica SIR-1]